MLIDDRSREQLLEENRALRRRLADQERDLGALQQLEWLLQKGDQYVFGVPRDEGYTGQRYGDLVQLNTDRTLADSVGRELLEQIAGDYLDLLGTSGAIYEKNGDYALGIFSSGWCRTMDQASRDLCGTRDDRAALASGRWHCHESCWECSKQAIDTRRPADIECRGGIRLYAVPVVAGGEVVGSINFGYGAPPRDEGKLQELAQRYGIKVEELRQKAAEYPSRPPFIIELAKRRLQTAAKLIGEIVARKRVEEELQRKTADLEQFNRLLVGREQRIIDLKQRINELSKQAGLEPPYDLSFANEVQSPEQGR